MRREMQINLEIDANHRALRRCHGCGAYVRPFEDVNGAIRCERCAERARRRAQSDGREPEENLTTKGIV